MLSVRRGLAASVTNFFPSSFSFVEKTRFKNNFPSPRWSFASHVCRVDHFSPVVGRFSSASALGLFSRLLSSAAIGPLPGEGRGMSLSQVKASTPPNGADRKMPFMIGVAGGTASGKTTVCDRIIEAVNGPEAGGPDHNIVSLSQDCFYRELNEQEGQQAKRGLFNFDHPDAFDHDLMLSCLADIREGKITKVPVYDFKTNSRVEGRYKVIRPSDVVLVEGILVFYHKDVMEMFNMKLFVDTDADTRLARRLLRDIEERGRDLEHVLQQYMTLVKPAFEEFCLPTKKHADVIIPRGADNTVAISLVAQHIKDFIWRLGGGCDCGSNGGTGGKVHSPFARSRSNSDSFIR